MSPSTEETNMKYGYSTSCRYQPKLEGSYCSTIGDDDRGNEIDSASNDLNKLIQHVVESSSFRVFTIQHHMLDCPVEEGDKIVAVIAEDIQGEDVVGVIYTDPVLPTIIL